MDVVARLLDAGADVNKAREDSGATPLFIAAQNGNGRALLLVSLLPLKLQLCCL